MLLIRPPLAATMVAARRSADLVIVDPAPEVDPAGLQAICDRLAPHHRHP